MIQEKGRGKLLEALQHCFSVTELNFDFKPNVLHLPTVHFHYKPRYFL